MIGIARDLVTLFAVLLLAVVGAPPARAAETIVYYHTDALHSVSVVTDAQGQVLERTHYAPYGQVLNRPLRDGPGYTGHREDAASGLVYMQQRYYDPEVGRFLSVDPVEADAETGGNFNRYWYANDNPYRYTDPDGRETGIAFHSEFVAMGAQPQTYQAPEDWVGPALNVAFSLLPVIGTSYGIVAAAASPTAGGMAGALAGVLPAGRFVKEAGVVKDITLTIEKHGEAAIHAADAIKAGKRAVLTIARDAARSNRSAATGGLPKVAGKQLDEYPPAMFKEGGSGASTRAINPSNNMSAGACIGNKCRGLVNGDKVRIRVKKKE